MKIGYLMQAGVPDIRQQPLDGPGTHVKHVFDELSHLGHEVELLAYLDEGQIWKSKDLEHYEPVVIPWLDRGPLRLFESAVRRLQSELRLPYAALFKSIRFAQACRQQLRDCDVFYERMGWMGYGGGLISRWLGIPLVLEVNGDHLAEFEILGVAPQGAQRKVSTFLMKRAAHRAAHVVATGEGWRQRFINRWEVSPDQVTVVENGSQMVNMLKREQLSCFNERLNSSQPVTIVYIGAFEPWHGLTILLRATAKAIANGASVCVKLIGSGTELEQLKSLVETLKLRDRVTLTGHLQPFEFAPQLAGADIGVSPYCGRVEYSGLKLLDYKAAGLVTIASGENGQPAVINHGHTGWIVPPCDEDALCQAIVTLAADANLRKRIGQTARLEAEQCHSWQYTAKQLVELFEKVVAK